MKKLSVSILIILIILGSVFQLALANTPKSYCAEPGELLFLELLNSYREDNNLSTLMLAQNLGASAKHHADSMATNGYFDHNVVPEGKTWWEVAQEHKVKANWRGENIAYGYKEPKKTFEQFKNSNAHNKTMLGEDYKSVGIARSFGKAPNGSETYYWVVQFGDDVSDSVASSCDDATKAKATSVPPTADISPVSTATPVPTAEPVVDIPPDVLDPEQDQSNHLWCSKVAFSGVVTRQCGLPINGEYTIETEVDGNVVVITVLPDQRVVKATLRDKEKDGSQ